MRKANSFALILIVCLSSVLMAVETRIFDYPTDDWDPAWAPNGECLAFTSDLYASNHIFLIGCDGNFQDIYINSESYDMYPAFSPDGQHIAFNSGRSGQPKIWFQPIEGDEAQTLCDGEMEEGAFCWSYDGSAIFFEVLMDNNNWEIKRKSVSVCDAIQITDNPAEDRAPVASRDGNWLAFTSDRYGDPEIMLMNLNTMQTTRLTEASGMDKPECWSPDSRWLSFYTERNGNGDIWVADLQDPQNPIFMPLIEDNANDCNSCWNQAGDKIAFNSNRSGTNDIWVIDVALAADEDIQIAAPTKVTIYPNPFNPDTSIQFELAKQAHTTIDVFDLRGRKIDTIMNEMLPVGKHTCRWNGIDHNGKNASSGVYLFRIRSGSEQWVQRAMLLK